MKVVILARWRRMPHVNTEAMNLHLKEISRNVPIGAHAVALMDGAGWHQSHDLVVPKNLSILRLPPYSPELNAQENIWQRFRQNDLAGRIFETYTSIASRDWIQWHTSWGRWYKTSRCFQQKQETGQRPG